MKKENKMVYKLICENLDHSFNNCQFFATLEEAESQGERHNYLMQYFYNFIPSVWNRFYTVWEVPEMAYKFYGIRKKDNV